MPKFRVLTSVRIKSICMFQSTFQTVQLTASAEIDTYNPQIYVIEENTVMVSTSCHPSRTSLGQAFISGNFKSSGSSHLCICRSFLVKL